MRSFSSTYLAPPPKAIVKEVGLSILGKVLNTGAVLTVTSSDSVLHNAHAFYEDGSTAFNIAVPFPGMELPLVMDRPGVMKLLNPWTSPIASM